MPQRFGILAADPLRLLGMQTLFEKRDAVAVAVGDEVELHEGLAMTLIDAACTPDVFEKIAEFRATQPEMKVIVVGLSQDPEYVEQVIGTGARGYLTHEAKEAEILMAIDIVLDGSVWAPRKVLARLIEKGRKEREERQAAPRLTTREREVVDLLVSGVSNREIGEALKINEATVKAHVGRLMRKVGVSNRTALSLRAMEWRSGTDTEA